MQGNALWDFVKWVFYALSGSATLKALPLSIDDRVLWWLLAATCMAAGKAISTWRHAVASNTGLPRLRLRVLAALAVVGLVVCASAFVVRSKRVPDNAAETPRPSPAQTQNADALDDIGFGFQKDALPDGTVKVYAIVGTPRDATVQIRIEAVTGTSATPISVRWVDGDPRDRERRIRREHPDKFLLCSVTTTTEHEGGKPAGNRGGRFIFHGAATDAETRIPTDDMRRLGRPWELELRLRISDSRGAYVERRFRVFIANDGETHIVELQ